MRRPSIVVWPLLALVLFAAHALAQAPSPRVLLVLDASGSMYRTLPDGRTRIAAAKEALAAFLARVPSDSVLDVGLRVYGSRITATDAGACEDTTLIVPVAGFEREALHTAVRETQPLGATPIAYALAQAAGDFGATPGPALIVLVTDGEESCGGDLRGVLAALAAQGIDVDLRIVGIDLSDLAARAFAGLGAFENVTSAPALADALGRAVEVVEAPARYRTTVTLTRDGAPTTEGARVTFVDTLSGEATDLVVGADGVFAADLVAGTYRAEVADVLSDAPLMVGGLSVVAGSANAFAFELASAAEVVLTVAPEDPLAGGSVTAAFTDAPRGDGWVALAPVGSDDATYLTYARATGGDGAVVLRVPETTEPLEARYVVALPGGGDRVLGRSEPFTPRAVVATVAAPTEVMASATFEVAWTGPALDGDYVTVVPSGAADAAYGSFAYVAVGRPARLSAPYEPGRYEVRYVTGAAGTVLARAAIAVVAAEASLQVVAEVMAGASFEVAWTGPDGPGDYVTIVPAGAGRGAYLSFANADRGSPAVLTAPIEPGAYEVRYVSGQGDQVLAAAAIIVTEVGGAVHAPAEVAPGATFEVAWTGPGYDWDYVTIVPEGTPEGEYRDWAYVGSGNPATLVAPDEPGRYEVRYVLGQGDVTLARTVVEVR